MGIKNFFKRQITPSQATIEYRWDGKYFYLNSEAGHIKYRPKDLKDQTQFRDKYINELSRISALRLLNRYYQTDLYRLYDRILSEKKVSYTANFLARWERFKHCVF